MKNFALYYQIKRLQCLVLPTLFFLALFIFEMIEVPEKPFNTIIAVIAILIGYYCLLRVVENWDDWLEILMTTTFCFSIVFALYSIGMYFTQQTTLDKQINNWMLTHLGKYFSESCLLPTTWIILLFMTASKIMPAIRSFVLYVKRIGISKMMHQIQKKVKHGCFIGMAN